MRVLLLGSGGRENALAWGLARSSLVTEVVAAPGNPGMAALGEVATVAIEDPAAVTDLARRLRPDLVVIGPEAPLVAGVGDELVEAGFKVFGPRAAAARVEGSKAHAKALMDKAGIPTAEWEAFETPDGAIAFLDHLGPPYVVKADGLAGGKGVVVTMHRDVAVEAIRERLAGTRFGDAGKRVVIEEFLDGEEVSLIAFTDGRNLVPCEPAQDYKRVFDGDRGPNTGGMGSYSPVPSCPPPVADSVAGAVLQPMIDALAAEGAPFVGALYAGLALTTKGPRVVEFNARFGDPETQALIPRLESDLAELCLACAEGDLEGAKTQWSSEVCIAVVLASAGYPGDYETGVPIRGIERAAEVEGVQVFHAGTAERDGSLVTAGGRVVSVAATAATFGKARDRAYEAAGMIEFRGKQARSDIGLRPARAEGETR